MVETGTCAFVSLLLLDVSVLFETFVRPEEPSITSLLKFVCIITPAELCPALRPPSPVSGGLHPRPPTHQGKYCCFYKACVPEQSL